MRTASRPAGRGQLGGRPNSFPPPDPASRQLARDADATMMVAEGHECTGLVADSARWAARREENRLPQ
ncbi:hypothetical protein QMK33_15235 [Hymenobacter sp. H14-R3]|uniref:hypothetical protein n=1 Tax=Hymenobacter sp. H14-R3 TaxID=3046308 RepID=UPI0024BBA6E0|nr:hypothetical protein [Hymenobacter sp. H14-R3]MDJ0366512.1 hypothetical protein [Hymenobacter sp. H14-R3]